MKISELENNKKTLYVCRPLINPDEFIKWAKEQGFKKTLNKNDLHVTIAYSNTPFNWSNIKEQTNQISCKDGNRTIKKLGDEGAIVLAFHSEELKNRWKEFLDAGASWDYEEYTPHITVSYDSRKIDLNKIKPFEGELIFGPEKFKEVDKSWAKKVKKNLKLDKNQ